MKTPRINLLAAWAVTAAVSAGLAGCGGSSDNDDMMTGGGVSPVTGTGTLPEKANLSLNADGEGEQTLEKDKTQEFEDGSVVKCEGPGDCALTFKRNPAGDYHVHSTGGTIDVMEGRGDEDIPLPTEHMIRAALDKEYDPRGQSRDEREVTVDAGKYKDVGGVRFSCPAAGGLSCTVTFKVDASSGPSGVTAMSKVKSGGRDNGIAEAARISWVTDAELGDLRDLVRETPNPFGNPNDDTDNGEVPVSVFRLNDEKSLADPDDDGKSSTASKFKEDPSHMKAAMVPSGNDEWKGGPWSGKAWEADLPAGDQILVRFTNREADKARSFAQVYGDESGNSDNVVPGDLEGADAAEKAMAFWSLMKSAAVSGRTGAQSVTVRGGTGINAEFDGVEGTLKCTMGSGSNCTFTNDAGKLSDVHSNNGNWEFMAKSSIAQVLTKDDDYLAFGWWRKSEEIGDGLESFQPIWGGRMPFTTNNGLKGTATYEGGAAGNYTYGGSRNIETHGGWFVADAKLTATFGQAGRTVDPKKDNKITGTISDFKGQHGPLGNWVVKLNGTVASSGISTITPGDVTGAAGNAEWNGGAWDADFYGESTPATKLPSSIAGWFHARTDAGVDADSDGDFTDTGDTAPSTAGIAVQGSFGAVRQP